MRPSESETEYTSEIDRRHKSVPRIRSHYLNNRKLYLTSNDEDYSLERSNSNEIYQFIPRKARFNLA